MKRSRSPSLLLAMAALLQHAAAFSPASFPLGSQATVQLPPAPYQLGFASRDVVLGAQGEWQPGLVAAVSVEAGGAGGSYTCALVVVLGDVKVWASDHLEKFVPTGLCRLELTGDGQLRLTDGAGAVGWVTGTAGQGVQNHDGYWLHEPEFRRIRTKKTTNASLFSNLFHNHDKWDPNAKPPLNQYGTIPAWFRKMKDHICLALDLNRRTGNLVLIDAQNRTKWQSFDHPTDTLLRGEQHTLPLYFIVPTTKVISSAAFYSFELDGDKIAAYITLGLSKYSYWELAPIANRTMASARLDGSGLRMLDPQGTAVAQITPPVKKPPLSFLKLEEDGNLGMYYYAARHRKFKASYRALGFCELPLSCGVGEVCSAAGNCNDGLSVYADRPARGGSNASSGGDICGGDACMVHLRGVTTVLRTTESPVTDVTLRQCVEQCARDVSCSAALYVTDDVASVAAADHGVCSHYTMTVGAREVTGASHRFSYWVKSRAGGGGGGEGGRGGGGDEDDDDTFFHGPIRTIIIVCGAVDLGCALVFVVLVVLYIRRRRQHVAAADEPPAGEIEGVEMGQNNEAVQN
ncbi:hypothetical protein EJB05_18600, partial [Eragrostis curvula]